MKNPDLCLTRRWWMRHYLKLHDSNDESNIHQVPNQNLSLPRTNTEAITGKVAQQTEVPTY
eukprot:8414489-Prorocentrum_lima.AAC.1